MFKGGRGFATKRTCVLKNLKVIFFCHFCWHILVYVQRHYKNRYFSTFLKAEKQKMTLSKGYKLLQHNNANLAPELTLKNLGAQLVVSKKRAETTIFIVFLTNGVYERTNLALEITF